MNRKLFRFYVEVAEAKPKATHNENEAQKATVIDEDADEDEVEELTTKLKTLQTHKILRTACFGLLLL